MLPTNMDDVVMIMNQTGMTHNSFSFSIIVGGSLVMQEKRTYLEFCEQAEGWLWCLQKGWGRGVEGEDKDYIVGWYWINETCSLSLCKGLHSGCLH